MSLVFGEKTAFEELLGHQGQMDSKETQEKMAKKVNRYGSKIKIYLKAFNLDILLATKLNIIIVQLTGVYVI